MPNKSNSNEQKKSGNISSTPTLKYPITKDGIIYNLKKEIRKAIVAKDIAKTKMYQKDICKARSDRVCEIIKNKVITEKDGSTNIRGGGQIPIAPGEYIKCEIKHDNLSIPVKPEFKSFKHDTLYLIDQKIENITPVSGIFAIMEYLEKYAWTCKRYFLPNKQISPASVHANTQFAESLWLLQEIFNKIKNNGVQFTLTRAKHLQGQLQIESDEEVYLWNNDFDINNIKNPINNETHVIKGSFSIEFHEKPKIHVNKDQNDSDVFLLPSTLETLNKSLLHFKTHVFAIKIKVENHAITTHKGKTRPVKYTNNVIQHVLEVSPYAPVIQQAVFSTGSEFKLLQISKLFRETKVKNVIKHVCRVITEDECTQMLVSEMLEKKMNINATTRLEHVDGDEWPIIYEKSNILVEFFSNLGYCFTSLTVKKPVPYSISLLIKYNSLNTDLEQPKNTNKKKRPLKISFENGEKMGEYVDEVYINLYPDSSSDLSILSERKLGIGRAHFAKFKMSEAEQLRSSKMIQETQFLGAGGIENDGSLQVGDSRKKNPRNKKNNTDNRGRQLDPASMFSAKDPKFQHFVNHGDGGVEKNSIAENVKKNRPRTGNKKHVNYVPDTFQTDENFTAWREFYNYFLITNKEITDRVIEIMDEEMFGSYTKLKNYIHYTLECKKYPADKGIFRAYMRRIFRAHELWCRLWNNYLPTVAEVYKNAYYWIEFDTYDNKRDLGQGGGELPGFFRNCCIKKPAKQSPGYLRFWYRDFAMPEVQKLNGVIKLIYNKNKDVSREIMACAMVLEHFGDVFKVNGELQNDLFVQFCCSVIHCTIFANPYLSPHFFYCFLLKLYNMLHMQEVMSLADQERVAKIESIIFNHRQMDQWLIELKDNFANFMRRDVTQVANFHLYIQFHNKIFFNSWETNQDNIYFNYDLLEHSMDFYAEEIDNVTVNEVMVVQDATQEYMDPNPPEPNIVVVPEVSYTKELYSLVEYAPLVRSCNYQEKQDSPVYVFYNNEDHQYYIQMRYEDNKTNMLYSIPFAIAGPDCIETYTKSDHLICRDYKNISWGKSELLARALFQSVKNNAKKFEDYKWKSIGSPIVYIVMVWKCLCELTGEVLDETINDNETFKVFVERLANIPTFKWYVNKFTWDFKLYLMPTEEAVTNGFYLHVKPDRNVPTSKIPLDLINIHLNEFFLIYTARDPDIGTEGWLLYPHEIIKLARAVRKYPKILNHWKMSLISVIQTFKEDTNEQYIIFNKYFTDICNNYVKYHILLPRKGDTFSMSNIIDDIDKTCESLRKKIQTFKANKIGEDPVDKTLFNILFAYKKFNSLFAEKFVREKPHMKNNLFLHQMLADIN